jgi:hypothetical protein
MAPKSICAVTCNGTMVVALTRNEIYVWDCANLEKKIEPLHIIQHKVQSLERASIVCDDERYYSNTLFW